VHGSLADQLTRAGESVVLNIAEGAAHFSPGRKSYHYGIAHGSAAECVAALSRIHRRNPTPAVENARRAANMVGVMLHALIQAQQRRRKD
jgi:four helix bundle protein